MTGTTGRGRRAAGLALAAMTALAGGAQAQGGTSEGRAAATARVDRSGQVTVELDKATKLATDYGAKAAARRSESQWSGAFVLASAFYGGLVTAFNPAPKNLKAAILAGGTATAWNVNLKPAERARVYAQGRLAMECVVSAGTPLLTYGTESYGTLRTLRDTALDALVMADKALNENPEEASPAQKFQQTVPARDLKARVEQLVTLMADQETAKAKAEKRKALQALAKTLGELDVKLAEEQAAYEEAPFRVASSRRQVEAAVAKLLQGAAPDYKAAAESIGKGLGDAAPSETAGAAGATPEAAPKDAKSLTAAVQRSASLDDAIRDVSLSIRDIQAKAPTQAAKASKHMGECVPKAG